MGRFRSWWQQLMQHRVAIGVVAIVLIVVIVLIIIGYQFDWTGFNGNNKSGKTLWDWLQLLIIPIIFAIGGFWLNQIQKDRDEKATEAQKDRDEKATEAQKQREENAAKEREKLERESREDNQRETALQAYLDKMSELLLEKQLRKSAEEDEVREIARARTLTVLRGLDPNRKASVIQFLAESGLIDKKKCVISLFNANLSYANLSYTNLNNTTFYGATLSGATLSGDLLNGTDLSYATLSGATLSDADFSGADLSYATLSGADFSGADLSKANLGGAIGVNVEELEKQAKLLKDATMPDWSIHP
jgi:uncharacterized protein YjbI with pentapeptide repeats